MIKDILKTLENKKIIILGFGIEGRSTYKFIRKYFNDMPITITYNKDDFEQEEEYLENDKNLKFITGKEYLKYVNEFDLIIKSPGVSFKGIDTSEFLTKVTSQLELFFENINCKTIGITGTKGKSTTSTLIYQMLIQQNRKARLLGNIGIPVFEQIEEIKEDEIIVLELSSHGLEYLKKSPNISILLDIYEEHLDHYESLEKYIEAKYNIFKYQKENDIAIYNMDNELMKKYNYRYKNNDYSITMKELSNKETFNVIYINENSIYHNEKKIYNTRDERRLKGIHMLNNIMFVLAISEILDLDINKTIKTINEFKSLEHRMEFVGKYNEIEYYNNSIATIPEATIDAIEALEKVNTLIVGGKDRGVDQTQLIEYLKKCNVENIICLPKTGEYIFEKIQNIKKKVILVQSLNEAVEYAKILTKKDTICLLSPAASSYGYFKDFKDRGNQFKSLVKK